MFWMNCRGPFPDLAILRTGMDAFRMGSGFVYGVP